MKTIHLVNPLGNAHGGSENRTLELWRILRDHADVQLWSPGEADPLIAADYPVRTIRLLRREQPHGGTLVVIGVYFELGAWTRFAEAERAILLYNTPERARLEDRLARLQRATSRPVEIVFASDILRRLTDRDGPVQTSPIDVDLFRPDGVRLGDDFVVGRVSRDESCKFHLGAPDLFRRLARAGCTVRLMGGTCLAPALAGEDGVRLYPEGTFPVPGFLQGLDCFLYRVADDWLETFGRVVHEAMACGLPVVCHWRGGYADHVDHGRTGFLFDHDREAEEIVMRLRSDRALRREIGHNARASVVERFGPALRDELRRFYLA